MGEYSFAPTGHWIGVKRMIEDAKRRGIKKSRAGRAAALLRERASDGKPMYPSELAEIAELLDPTKETHDG